MSNRATLIIPCYNEALRFNAASVGTLLDDDAVDLVLVDDGSTDATRKILEQMAHVRPNRVRVVGLDKNGGKAEAVRRGLAAAIEAGAGIVGYLDADLATPASEMHRLIRIMRSGDAQVVMGARCALLGRRIERSAVRHYLGRVFATFASLSLRLPVYDTQCGAKLFRVSSTLADAVSEPFISRWAFDVELLGRLLLGSEHAPPIEISSVWEEPLQTWCDVKGSKLSPRQMIKAALDLATIERDLAARRQRRRRPLATDSSSQAPKPAEHERARATR
jgi:glycosyltransferase involved in cell wall biosynthesis